MTVSAVIPNWNGGRRLEALLAGLATQSLPPRQVIVVDNGSADGSDLAAAAAGAEVIRLGRNRGFAAAVNRGVEQAAGPLTAVLNNDVELAPNWFELLTRALAAQPEAWAACGRIYQSERRTHLDGTFDLVSRAACAWRAGHGQPDHASLAQPRAVELVPMTAALVRRAYWLDAGGLDETFESYLEDVDLGLRAAQAGRSACYVPGAKAWHWGSATLGVWHPETVRRLARNQVFLIAKHYPPVWGWRYGWPVLVGQLLWGIVALRHHAFLPWVNGKAEGLARYAAVRRRSRPGAAGGLAALFRRHEALLAELQCAGGWKPYWRVYFALAGAPRAFD